MPYPTTYSIFGLKPYACQLAIKRLFLEDSIQISPVHNLRLYTAGQSPSPDGSASTHYHFSSRKL